MDTHNHHVTVSFTLPHGSHLATRECGTLEIWLAPIVMGRVKYTLDSKIPYEKYLNAFHIYYMMK